MLKSSHNAAKFLLDFVGEEEQKISLVAPDYPATKTFQEMMELMKKYFQPKPL